MLDLGQPGPAPAAFVRSLGHDLVGLLDLAQMLTGGTWLFTRPALGSLLLGPRRRTRLGVSIRGRWLRRVARVLPHARFQSLHPRQQRTDHRIGFSHGLKQLLDRGLGRTRGQRGQLRLRHKHLPARGKTAVRTTPQPSRWSRRHQPNTLTRAVTEIEFMLPLGCVLQWESSQLLLGMCEKSVVWSESRSGEQCRRWGFEVLR